MPRFVILEHDHPELHWDLMLEMGPSLRTWRLSRPPAAACGLAGTAPAVTAQPIGDHRLAYLDYEGPVSGNRGSVKRWDWGEYEELATPTGSKFLLAGQKFAGVILLDEGKLRVEIADAQ